MQTLEKGDLIHIFWMKNYANCTFQIRDIKSDQKLRNRVHFKIDNKKETKYQNQKQRF